VAVTLAALVALVVRFPRYLYHWDEVQLRLAARRVDLAWHEPHPPGYYLFVLLLRAAQRVIPDDIEPGRVVCTAAALALVWLVGERVDPSLDRASRALFQTAWGLFVVGSPLLGTYAVAGLTYAPEAAAWVAALLCLERCARARWALGVGLAGGLRPTVALWGALAAVAQGVRRGGVTARGGLLWALGLGLGVLSWWLPLVHETGGLNAYLRATAAVSSGLVWSRSALVLGFSALVQRLPAMASELLAGLGPWVLVVLWALRERARTHPPRWDRLAAGAGLAFGFYLATIHDTDGYLVTPVTCLAAFGLLGTAQGAARRAHAVARSHALAALAVALGTLLAPTLLAPRGFEGHARYAHHARWMDAHLATLRTFPPDNTVVVVAREYRQRGLRHLQYYLPTYNNLQLWRDPYMVMLTNTSPYLVVRGGRVEARGPSTLDLASLLEPEAQLRWVVLTAAEDTTTFVDGGCAPWGRRRGGVLAYAVPRGGTVHAADARLRCRPPRLLERTMNNAQEVLGGEGEGLAVEPP
jgi:hypothetical protein